MRTPSFRRTLSPTSAGRQDVPNFNPTRPFLPSPNTQGTQALQNLGKQIANIGQNMIDRDSSVKANNLSLEFNEEIAKVQNELKPDDYATWHKTIKEQSEALREAYERRADEVGLTDNDKAKLRSRLAADASTASLRAMQAARKQEAIIVPARIEALTEQVAEASAEGGFADPATRVRLQNLTDTIENAVPIVGRQRADEMHLEAKQAIERKYYTRQIELDPESVVAGGIDQFQFLSTEDGGALYNRAETEARAAKALRKEKFNADFASLDTAVSAVTSLAGNFDPQQPVDAKALEDKFNAVSNNIDALEKLYPEFSAGKLAGMRAELTVAGKAAYVRRELSVAERADVPRIIEFFRKEMNRASDEEIPFIDRWMESLSAAGQARLDYIDDREIYSRVLKGNAIVNANNDPEIARVVDEQFFEQAAPIALQQNMGLDPDENIQMRDLIVDNFLGNDDAGSVALGSGFLIGLEAVETFGYLPPYVLNGIQSLATDLTEDPEADVRRYWAIGALSKYVEAEPTLRDDLSKQVQTLVDTYNATDGDSASPPMLGGRIGEMIRLSRNVDEFSKTARLSLNQSAYLFEKGEQGENSIAEDKLTAELNKRILLFFKDIPDRPSDIGATQKQINFLLGVTEQYVYQNIRGGMDREAALDLAVKNVASRYQRDFSGGQVRLDRLGLYNENWRQFGSGITLEVQAGRTLVEFLKENPDLLGTTDGIIRRLSDRDIRVQFTGIFGLPTDKTPKNLGFKTFRGIEGVDFDEDGKVPMLGRDITLDFVEMRNGKPVWEILFQGRTMWGTNPENGQQTRLLFTPDTEPGQLDAERRIRVGKFKRKYFGPISQTFDGLIENMASSAGLNLPQLQIDTNQITPEFQE